MSEAEILRHYEDTRPTCNPNSPSLMLPDSLTGGYNEVQLSNRVKLERYWVSCYFLLIPYYLFLTIKLDSFYGLNSVLNLEDHGNECTYELDL